MKYIQLLPAAILASIALFGTWELWVSPYIKESNMDKNQIYQTVIDEGNPFTRPTFKYKRILDVKEGYVLYIDSAYQDTFTLDAQTFLTNVECINCN